MTNTEFLLTISTQYQADIRDENKEKHQLGDYQLIQFQILQTYIIRTVQQTVRRITNEIFGMRGRVISKISGALDALVCLWTETITVFISYWLGFSPYLRYRRLDWTLIDHGGYSAAARQKSWMVAVQSYYTPTTLWW